MVGTGLLRATLTLLAGAALAQALPLLLGPWLTRLYSPHDFGHYHLFAAVAANVAVVACARYEFALPVAADDREAALLRSLSLRVLGVVIVLCGLGASAWQVAGGPAWTWWLPAAVGALGLLSLATLLATRAGRFRVLAAARVVQHGGGAALQLLAGLFHGGVHGLIVAPIAAALAATAVLGLRRAGDLGSRRSGEVWLVARKHREFPLLNTPHAFLGAIQDTLTMAFIAGFVGAEGAGAWGLAMRYLKAPATLVGGALSQALYPHLAGATGVTVEGRAAVRQAMAALGAVAAPLVVGLWLWAPAGFVWVFGEAWREAGEVARALALYIGLHFVASPLGVVTMAWRAQRWALRFALAGQAAFVAALVLGLLGGPLVLAAWAVSAATALYFGLYFYKLATWPLDTDAR